MHTIVSAADFKYWRSLYQFLLSAERRGFGRDYAFQAYDLGLTMTVLRRLASRFTWCRFLPFAFENYPAHVALSRRNYAWKPLVIAKQAEKGGLLLWLDSATLFHTDDLSPIWEQIRRDGVYATKGQSTLEQHCDPLVLEALNVPPYVRRLPERVAGVLGFDCDNPSVRKLIAEWREYALQEAYISPRDPPLDTHRYEQALLTILLHRYEAEGLLRLPDAEIDVSSGRPIEWMSSRNKVPPWAPYWFDPFIRAYYAIYKSIDQALWRRRLRGIS